MLCLTTQSDHGRQTKSIISIPPQVLTVLRSIRQPANVKRLKQRRTVSASAVGESTTERRISFATASLELSGAHRLPGDHHDRNHQSLTHELGTTALAAIPESVCVGARRNGHPTATAPSATSRFISTSAVRHVPRTSPRPASGWSTATYELQSAGPTAAHGDCVSVLQETQSKCHGGLPLHGWVLISGRSGARALKHRTTVVAPTVNVFSKNASSRPFHRRRKPLCRRTPRIRI